ncbi:MAG: DUF4293 domain-containing protein [Paludibacteraceae bacterium]|nr:DUF4293 domain-containing protein [Paludibacteraceae bacterium]
MIQRIQTLYLLIIVIAMSFTLFLPSMRTISPEGIDYALSTLRGFYPVEQGGFHLNGVTMWLTITNIVILLIALFTIFTYKWRVIQMRFSSFNMVLLIGYYAIFFFTRYVILQQNPMDSTTLSWPIILPFISAILTYLAFRAIAKDEALVRSLDRLR